MNEALDWTWLGLFVAITVVRKVHTARAGRGISFRAVPPVEVVLMILWALAAAVAPLVWMFAPWLDFADYPFEWPVAVRIAGVVLFVVAIWLLHRAHVDLGRHFSLTVEFTDQHQLVTSGVYAWMRHPLYTAHMLWGLAQALLIPNGLAGPLSLLLMAALLAVRIPREQRALRDQFGDEWNDYAARTGRLLPRWRT